MRFKKRGYKHKTIDKAYNKAEKLKREQLLVAKQKTQDSNQVYLVTQYGNQANAMKQIIKKEIGKFLEVTTSLEMFSQMLPLSASDELPP